MLIGNLYGSPGLSRTATVSAMDWFDKAGFAVPNEADETRKKRKTIIDRGGG